MGHLLLRGACVDGRRVDIEIRDGRIERIASDLRDAGGETLEVLDRLVLPGFVETHIHPDKAFIADRTEGLRAGGPTAQTLVAELKKSFTVDDVYRRARRVLELAVRHGCTAMRAHVESTRSGAARLSGHATAPGRLGGLDLEPHRLRAEGSCTTGHEDLLREALRPDAHARRCKYMDGDQTRAH